MAETNPKKIYVGNLPRDYTESALREDFSRFGQIRRIEFKGRFGFVEYDNPTSASDAVSSMNGYVIGGDRIQVKSYHYIASRGKNNFYYPSGAGRQLAHADSYRDASRTPHRLLVLGLSDRTNWQDLKDFGRKVALVNYADVTRGSDGALRGILEFQDAEAMNLALEKLSGAELLGSSVRLVKERASSIPRRRRSHDSTVEYHPAERAAKRINYKSSSYAFRKAPSPHREYQLRRSNGRSRSPLYCYPYGPGGLNHYSPGGHRYRSYRHSPPSPPAPRMPKLQASVSPPLRGESIRRAYRDVSPYSRRHYSKHRTYYDTPHVPYSPPTSAGATYHHHQSSYHGAGGPPYENEPSSHRAAGGGPPPISGGSDRRPPSPDRRGRSAAYYHRY